MWQREFICVVNCDSSKKTKKTLVPTTSTQSSFEGTYTEKERRRVESHDKNIKGNKLSFEKFMIYEFCFANIFSFLFFFFTFTEEFDERKGR